MTEPLTVPSPAKINWMLRILRRRDDGFHDLETIFQTISLADVMTFERARTTSMDIDDPRLPVGETNLVMRAIRALEKESRMPPLHVTLEKRIPAQGGLGGGSSNAATTLLACRRLFDLAIPDDRMQQIALQLGSDVPFFLTGGTAWATGRGEQIAELTPLAGIPLLLVLPAIGVSTAEAFRALHPAGAYDGARELAPPLGWEWASQMAEEGLLDHAGDLTNDFEPVVFARHPELGTIRQRLASAGALWARMSGSGSTIASAWRTAEERDDAAARFADLRVVSCETTAPLTLRSRTES